MNRNRVLAFYISENDSASSAHQRSLQHWRQLINEFGFIGKSIQLGALAIHAIFEGSAEQVLVDHDGKITLVVGPHDEQRGSAYTELDHRVVRDRYLKVEISADAVVVTTDYVGSIPLFYSVRGHLSLSNIEPMVVLDSAARQADVSYENIFGFLKYSHYIWDETAFTHIFNQEPDSRFAFGRYPNATGLKKTYLGSLRATNVEKKLSPSDVAKRTYELNERLVSDAFVADPHIVLPLSSGYDSRMILAALSGKKQHQVSTFTYGPKGSIEVKAAQQLAEAAGFSWQHVDLKCDYLNPKYLQKVSLTMGGGLHYHGMYQFEFFEQALRNHKSAVLTSGFMTGVPAGQHISLMGIKSANVRLTDAMQGFAQSSFWSVDEICALSPQFSPSMIDAAEGKFRAAYDRFDGEPYQKSIVFDLWTRQRQFISYYPRSLEWCMPVVSPHMSPEYQNFFLTLPQKFLRSRRAIELMFTHHYPALASIASNSNGLRTISNPMQNGLFFATRVLRKLKLPNVLPAFFQDEPIIYDVIAARRAGLAGVAPVFSSASGLAELFSADKIQQLGDAMKMELARPNCRESVSYLKLTMLQALADNAQRL